MDGRKVVAFCKVCGAEGLELIDDCPRIIINRIEKGLDEKKQPVK
jgi:hypothetical protein